MHQAQGRQAQGRQGRRVRLRKVQEGEGRQEAAQQRRYSGGKTNTHNAKNFSYKRERGKGNKRDKKRRAEAAKAARADREAVSRAASAAREPVVDHAAVAAAARAAAAAAAAASFDRAQFSFLGLMKTGTALADDIGIMVEPTEVIEWSRLNEDWHAGKKLLTE